MTSKIETTPDDTGQKPVATRFKPGQSGNPGGRPRGARSRLGESFIESLAADFDEHGDGVIKVVRAREPATYLKIIKDILPREVLVKAFTAHANIDFTDVEDARTFLKAFRYVRDAQPELIEHIEEGSLVTSGWRHSDD
jgi:uncharacterized protein DUF5681